MSILDRARQQHAKPPEQKPPAPTEANRMMTLADAGHKYLDHIQRVGSNLFLETGISDLDYALSGGLEAAEMAIFAARPSHGKSAVAMQCLHGWTLAGLPCAIVSEEMSSLMLGKRTLQFVTSTHQEHWSYQAQLIRDELEQYRSERAPCYILESCRTAASAADRIEKCVKQNGVKAAVIDYAQLLQSPGRGRYEQITNTSIALRQLASRTNIVLLVLCQLSRDIEQRGEFAPQLSDLRDSGQLEQDADVVVFLHWPFRSDPSKNKSEYHFHVSKNRNREIKQTRVECHFEPARQMVRDRFPNMKRDESEIPQ